MTTSKKLFFIASIGLIQTDLQQQQSISLEAAMICSFLVNNFRSQYEVFMVNLVSVVRWVENTILWINLYPVDSAKRFSDLSVEQRYPPCKWVSLGHLWFIPRDCPCPHYQINFQSVRIFIFANAHFLGRALIDVGLSVALASFPYVLLVTFTYTSYSFFTGDFYP